MKTVIVIFSLVCMLSTAFGHGGLVGARVPACWNSTDPSDDCGSTVLPCGLGVRGAVNTLPTIAGGSSMPAVLFYQYLGHTPTNPAVANNSYVLTFYFGDPNNGTNLIPTGDVLTIPQTNSSSQVFLTLLPSGAFSVPNIAGIFTLQCLYNATADTVTPGQVYPSCVDFVIVATPVAAPVAPPTASTPTASTPTSSTPTSSTPTAVTPHAATPSSSTPVASSASSFFINVLLLALLGLISFF
jgi:hypothetical protein